MPELPEVETVVRGLRQKVLNQKIEQVRVFYEGIIAYPSVDDFKAKISNQTIHEIERYGKWIIFVLDEDVLLSHLRMEGKYFVQNSEEAYNRHDHIAFVFSNHLELRYRDVRKFGKMLLIPKAKINEIGPFKEMGLEPWDPALTGDYLKEKLKKKTQPIKNSLLDQSIIVGIGNIYADEILFLCHLSPLKKSNTLTDEERKSIIRYTKEVLEKAIQKGGTTIRSYTSLNGIHGLFQQELLVHGKAGKHCSFCGEIILKIKVGGRGTYYCPNCQRNS